MFDATVSSWLYKINQFFPDSPKNFFFIFSFFTGILQPILYPNIKPFFWQQENHSILKRKNNQFSFLIYFVSQPYLSVTLRYSLYNWSFYLFIKISSDNYKYKFPVTSDHTQSKRHIYFRYKAHHLQIYIDISTILPYPFVLWIFNTNQHTILSTLTNPNFFFLKNFEFGCYSKKKIFFIIGQNQEPLQRTNS